MTVRTGEKPSPLEPGGGGIPAGIPAAAAAVRLEHQVGAELLEDPAAAARLEELLEDPAAAARLRTAG